MTPLDLAEELRAHPEARDELTNHMARQGRRSAAEQALDVMIEAIEQAAPTAKG